MKAILSIIRRMRASFARIHLVDRCLVVFMCILLMQSAYSLLFRSASTQEANNIDTIVRTSAAAIFGYFISANFIKAGSTPQSGAQPPEVRSKNTGSVQYRIGFFDPDSAEDPSLTNGRADNKSGSGDDFDNGRLQILIVAHIGFAALCILLLYRNFGQSNAAAPAILSQLRDFVSGCVGFLIGCETTQK